MSLAHLFDQPVVKPRPTRVVRGLLDIEPKRAPEVPLVYSGPINLVEAPAEQPDAPRGKRPARTEQERLEHRRAKRRDYGRTYRAKQAAAGVKKKRKPYAEFTEEEKAKRRARQLAYYLEHRERIAQRERDRRAAKKKEAARAA